MRKLKRVFNVFYIIVPLFLSINIHAQNSIKTYYGFDLRGTKLILFDSTYEFSYDNLVSKGSFEIRNNLILFSDSLSTCGHLKPHVDWSLDNKIEDGKMKISVLFKPRNTVILTSFYSWDLFQEVISDSVYYLRKQVDSFYFNFL